MIDLNSEIKFLPGTGPARAEKLFKETGIADCEDLVYFFPYKYIDRSKFYTVREINSDIAFIQLKGIISEFKTEGVKYKQRLTAKFTDPTGTLQLIWFQGADWVKKSLVSGKEYIIFGKPTRFNSSYSIAHPDIEDPLKKQKYSLSEFYPQYSSTEGLKEAKISSKTIRNLLITFFQNTHLPFSETLPEYLIGKFRLMSLTDSLKNVHFPLSKDHLAAARFRLKFEELFYIQLNIIQHKALKSEKSKGLIFKQIGDKFNTFYSQKLPFELTDAQKRVVKEIRADFLTGKQCNRLLQGDVGSGKTLVALMCMLIAIDNGYQACMMAPTEILANQHYNTIKHFLGDMPVSINLLTGSTKTKDRKALHNSLIDGSLDILIGTHALIEDSVEYKNLGLAVIDEQHRFGVAQRAKLFEKNTTPPHVIVMTATPIPRTLAMTLYGDLDVSVIDQLPPGRKPIKTMHCFDSKRLGVFKFIKERIAEGRQVYMVYPLIEESENFTYKDLTDGVESISRAFPPPQYAISVVHGRMKPEEKEKSMAMFVKGITQIMIATTVIEVGVNVPNATIMLIESAEKFGLSQLHQLRGRVGRGADQSYCILMTSYEISAESRKRLRIMVSSNDGFEIAEEDLKLRGPGDIDGTQQSGMPVNLKIADLSRDSKILHAARYAAVDILKADPNLRNPLHAGIKARLQKLYKEEFDWSRIS